MLWMTRKQKKESFSSWGKELNDGIVLHSLQLHLYEKYEVRITSYSKPLRDASAKWSETITLLVFISTRKNLRTLNSELEANFRIDVTTLKNTSVIKEEAILKIHKPTPPILEITRIKKRIVRKWEGKNSYELVKENIQKNAIYRDVYTLNFSKKWEMLEVLPWVEIVETIDSISLYSILAPIAQNYHISYLELKKQIEKAFGENLSLDHISVIAKQIESQMSGYETIEELVTQALAIIKIKDEQWNDVFEKDEKGVYFHTIQFTRGKYKENDSVHTKLVWKESIVSNPNNIWFHFSPYNFDSEPEKDFFLFMLTELQIRTDDIDDIYFTGSLTDKRKTDMHFEYKWKDKAWHNYFPDFVIVKKNGEYLIVEIKSRSESNDPDVIEKARIVKRLEDIDTNKFKYMVLYADSDIIALSEKMKALDVLKFSK
jgi:type III restriction enzyme